MYGVSRVVIREAIRHLELSGLVEIKRGPAGGALVLAMKHDSVSRVIKDVLRLGKAKVSDLMEVRLDIEPIVAALAAERRTPEELAMLSRNLQTMPEAPGDEYVTWNLSFHRLVARASHNPLYEILVNILMDLTGEFVLRTKPPELVLHDTVSHSAIFQRIKQRDSAEAKRKFREHLEDIVPLLKDLENKMARKLSL